MVTTHPAPSPLEVAHALRKTAEFCRDPDSPKCLEAEEAVDAKGKVCAPTHERAIVWCALGYIKAVVGSNRSINRLVPGCRASSIYVPFDVGDYEGCALYLDELAATLEAGLPVTERRVPVPA